MKFQSILLTIISLKLTAARFTSLGIKELFLEHCESEIIYTADHHDRCLMRKLEVEMDTEENKTYIKCVLEVFGYWTGREKFDEQALLKDYHQAGIKDRDKAVVDSYRNCIKNYGFSTNPMKILDCVTKDKDFPNVINAKREKNSHWKPDWVQAYCGGM
uniref:Salivary short D7 protein n=1 Tax=Culex tarsalis TaxID=7177 RepID=B8RJ77_CULTA